MKVDWLRYRSFIYGTWEPEVVRVLSAVVKEGFTAIDIGAHIGFYALVLSRLVGRRGHVIAFEPLPGNFEILTENLRLNNCAHVEAINRAVLGGPRNLDVSLPDQEPLPGSVSLFNHNGSRVVPVQAVSLDEFLRERICRVDFIQMDVEGAEAQVLQGARATIEASHPAMVIEIHHFDGRLEANPVPSQLCEMGYEIRWLDRCESTSHLLAVWRQPSSVRPAERAARHQVNRT